MEELGLPLLHSDSSGKEFVGVTLEEYFKDCPSGQVTTTCNNNTMMPADFWLFDSRSYPIVFSTDFIDAFPDKALIKGQYWHFARNDGAISYRAQTRVLNEVASRLERAELLHDRTECTDVSPTSLQHLNSVTGGLNGEQ